ncbi:hypothetical protein SNEBB_003550 [Seison nebaliae]|nr:hypothetical protein SNEBB_003550 [Seison nebaliae]
MADECPNGFVKIKFYPNETQGHTFYPKYRLTNACPIYNVRTFVLHAFYFRVSFYCSDKEAILPDNICVVLNKMFSRRLCLDSATDEVLPELDMDVRDKSKIWKQGSQQDIIRLKKEREAKKINKEQPKKDYGYGILIFVLVFLVALISIGAIVMKKWKQYLTEQLENMKGKTQDLSVKASSPLSPLSLSSFH